LAAVKHNKNHISRQVTKTSLKISVYCGCKVVDCIFTLKQTPVAYYYAQANN